MIYSSLFKFFFCDGPVISDFIRFVIYSSLLLQCLIAKYDTPPVGDSPLQAHLLLQRTHPLFWCIANKFSSYFLIIHKYKYLQALSVVAKTSWVCCVIGFGGVFSRLITGLSVFILSTTTMGIGKIGVNHRWHIPMWTLIALIFTKFKVYSVDWFITCSIDDRYNVEPNYVIFDSGFSSKFIQCISLYTLFAGGISKLLNSGIRWILPGTLIFYLSDPSIEDNTTFLAKFRNNMRRLIIQYPCFVLFLTIQSLLIELTSIFSIVLPSIRLSVVILAWLFHFGIWLLMSINYLPQCVCYLMIIDNPFLPTKLHHESSMQMITVFDLVCIAMATMIIFGCVQTLFFRYEGWPFSPFPMYSMDRRQFSHSYLIDENQLYDMAKKEVHLTNGLCHDGEFNENGTWIRITKNDETKDMIDDISSRVCILAFQHCLWSAVMRSILIAKVEINVFTSRLFDVLVADDVQLVKPTDYINVDIHFKNGWKTYATTLAHKNYKKSPLLPKIED